MRSDFCSFAGSGRVEWVPRSVVYIRGPVLDSVLVHHTYQVCSVNLYAGLLTNVSQLAC